ncbi:MAG: hypothetical protein A2171_00365 [Candidatus Levybacteria bacterium RBG_13_35_9]|nr:MAG: hypothetical protein A2171_00365 [Candidatus Levybacteria bacterium RBG_13_35_9]
MSILADKDLLGKVIHYYDKIGVAVIKLEKNLKVGDNVKFAHGEDEFEQNIESMQLEHEQVQSGKKGEEVAVKVDKETKSGTLVYLK